MDLVSWHEMEERVKKVITDMLGLSRDEVTLNASYVDDLGADSLDVVELVMSFEEEFDLEIPDEAAERMVTVANTLDYFAKLMPEHIRDKIDTRVIAFRVREDGKIQVGMRATDGTWTYADGTSLLPSGVYLTVFSKWGEVLKELEEIINDPHAKERDLQLFFEKYPELLKGDDYDRVISQACIICEDQVIQEQPWRADFALSPIDQTNFCKLLELKIPKMGLIRKPKSNHPRFYSLLWEAIYQLRDYGEAFNNKYTRDRFKEMYRVNVFKPDLQLVIGRRWNMTYIESMLDFQKHNHIRIEDWDTHLEKLRRKFA